MKKLKIGLGVKLLFLISIVISSAVAAYSYFFPVNDDVAPPNTEQQEGEPTAEPEAPTGLTLEASYDPVTDTWHVS